MDRGGVPAWILGVLGRIWEGSRVDFWKFWGRFGEGSELDLGAVLGWILGGSRIRFGAVLGWIQGSPGVDFGGPGVDLGVSPIPTPRGHPRVPFPPRPGPSGRGGRVVEAPAGRVPHRGFQSLHAAAEPELGGFWGVLGRGFGGSGLPLTPPRAPPNRSRAGSRRPQPPRRCWGGAPAWGPRGSCRC